MASVEHAQAEVHDLSADQVTTSDEDLQARIDDALWRYEPLRVLRAPLTAQVRHGEVTLTGVVPSRIIHRGVIEIIQRIPGIQAVHDQIVTDTDLDQAVTLALAQAAETQAWSADVQVGVRNGIVQLIGVVPDVAASEAIARLAANVPGVRRVVNLLRVGATAP